MTVQEKAEWLIQVFRDDISEWNKHSDDEPYITNTAIDCSIRCCNEIMTALKDIECQFWFDTITILESKYVKT